MTRSRVASGVDPSPKKFGTILYSVARSAFPEHAAGAQIEAVHYSSDAEDENPFPIDNRIRMRAVAGAETIDEGRVVFEVPELLPALRIQTVDHLALTHPMEEDETSLANRRCGVPVSFRELPEHRWPFLRQVPQQFRFRRTGVVVRAKKVRPVAPACAGHFGRIFRQAPVRNREECDQNRGALHQLMESRCHRIMPPPAPERARAEAAPAIPRIRQPPKKARRSP